MRVQITQSVLTTAHRTGLGRVNPPVQASLFRRESQGSAGFTLVEVVLSVAIVALVFGGVIKSYIQAGQRVEWTGYSMAAQSLAAETIEQAKSASWDPAQNPPVNQLTNLNLLSGRYTATNATYTGYTVSTLDVPVSGSNSVPATNFVMVQMIEVNSNANVVAQFIRVDTVWPFGLRGANAFYTNTVCTMIAPDNRANGTF